jgi:hypothetical protein
MICLPELASNHKMEVAAKTKRSILFPTINGHIQVHGSTVPQ